MIRVQAARSDPRRGGATMGVTRVNRVQLY